MGGSKKAKPKKIIRPEDFEDYGDYMKAKKEAEENAS